MNLKQLRETGNLKYESLYFPDAAPQILPENSNSNGARGAFYKDIRNNSKLIIPIDYKVFRKIKSQETNSPVALSGSARLPEL